jgi:hypothetical protein
LACENTVAADFMVVYTWCLIWVNIPVEVEFGKRSIP